jgi:segregation and condensation protein A
MDACELLATIENLIHQAQAGKIDPWDVRVIEVIDRYIELMTSKTIKTGYETDLSQSGQAILSASMLVLFKANTLMQWQSAQDEQETGAGEILLAEESEDTVLPANPRLPLERHLRRRPAAMPPSKRRVSLQELLEQLQLMAQQLKLQEKVNQTPRGGRRQSNLQSMRAALELAHQENLTEVAEELEQVLYSWSKQLCLERNWLNLEQLVQLWMQTKQSQQNGCGDDSPNSYLVGVFWALLLLSAQSKVELWQEEFYQDIKIRLLTNTEKK